MSTGIPKSIVVYDHYGHSVYFDGVLAGHFGPDEPTNGWRALCALLGISFSERSVDWADMPGQREDKGACHHPPKLLETMERHFATLEEQRKVSRIKSLREELARLTGE